MDATALTDWFDERVADHRFSGVALVWRDGGPVYEYAGGLAHRGLGVPITQRTRFAVASVTKMVTATAIMRLVDRDLIRLDQPVIELLPPDERPAAVTADHLVRHLLAHTSGLANYHDDDDPTWTSFTSIFDRIPSYRMRRPTDMLPLFIDLPAVFPPGTAFQYNDAAYILLGLIVERVTGRPYVDVVTDDVLRPAGMVDSSFEPLDSDPARMAVGYLTSPDVPSDAWISNIFSVTASGMPDGGMISNPRDLVRLVEALMAGRLVSPSSLSSMRAPQGPPSSTAEQFGLGLALTLVDGAVVILGHSGSDPGVSALVSHHLATATTIVVLCNQDRGALAATLRLEDALGIDDPRS